MDRIDLFSRLIGLADSLDEQHVSGEEVAGVLRELADQLHRPQVVDFVFDTAPGPRAPRFIDVEDEKGASVRVGVWLQRADGCHVLRVPSVRVAGRN